MPCRQVNELQRSLQSATEKMLSAEMQPAVAPPAVKAPQSMSLEQQQCFCGLLTCTDLDIPQTLVIHVCGIGRSKAPKSSKGEAQEKQAATPGGYEAPVMLASADIFSGLDLPGFETDPEPAAPPAVLPAASTSASAAAPLAERHPGAPQESSHGRSSRWASLHGILRSKHACPLMMTCSVLRFIPASISKEGNK